MQGVRTPSPSSSVMSGLIRWGSEGCRGPGGGPSVSELRDILFDPPSLLDLERTGGLSWVLSWFWPKETTCGHVAHRAIHKQFAVWGENVDKGTNLYMLHTLKTTPKYEQDLKVLPKNIASISSILQSAPLNVYDHI